AHAKLVESRTQRSSFIRYLVLLTCFTSALLLTYQHMLPFVWVFAGTYSLVLAIQRKNARPIWVSALGGLIAFAVAAALSPPRALAFLAFFKYIAAVQAGWFMPFFTPDYLAG